MNPPDSESGDDGDWTLAGRAAAGSEPDFEQLIHRHQEFVHRFIHRAVGHDATARDLAQETFVRAWFALPRLQPGRNGARFTSWLCRIAMNLCRDHWKSKGAAQARKTQSLFAIPSRSGSDERWIDPESPCPRPDEAVMARDLQQAASDAIKALPDRWRLPFLLAVVDGLPHATIAELTGASVKSVESRIYRARRRLAQQLHDLGFDVTG